MPKKTPAAELFNACGIAPDDYTAAMRLAVKQRWSGLPIHEKVDVLRARLAAVQVASVDPAAVCESLAADTPAAALDAATAAEVKRLKRNASVNAWRERNQLQAALDAREAKFAALRARRKVA